MTRYIYILFATIIFSISCEDVIEIDINEASGDLVIDAWIDNRNQAQEIRLTEAQAYFDNILSNPNPIKPETRDYKPEL